MDEMGVERSPKLPEAISQKASAAPDTYRKERGKIYAASGKQAFLPKRRRRKCGQAMRKGRLSHFSDLDLRVARRVEKFSYLGPFQGEGG